MGWEDPNSDPLQDIKDAYRMIDEVKNRTHRQVFLPPSVYDYLAEDKLNFFSEEFNVTFHRNEFIPEKTALLINDGIINL